MKRLCKEIIRKNKSTGRKRLVSGPTGLERQYKSRGDLVIYIVWDCALWFKKK